MKEDGHHAGNILFVDQFSIKTTDGQSTSIVVGSDNDYGYVEGVGDAARFKTIFGFMQWNSSLLIVADSGNHCLRYVDRATKRTSHFVGQCQRSGMEDGSNAKFNFPYALMKNGDDIIVSDNYNNAIRVVDTNSNLVSTLIHSMVWPKDMVMDGGGQKFYVNTMYSVASVDISAKSYTILTSTARGFQDGALSSSQYTWPAGLDWMDSSTLVVADVYTNRTRMISLSDNTVSSECAAVSTRSSAGTSCPFYYVESVLRVGNTLYIGGEGSINAMTLS